MSETNPGVSEQLAIQAKLRLNADVIGQAAPDSYGFMYDREGPDYLAVLVPGLNPLAGIASRLGLIVFYASQYPKWTALGVNPSRWLSGLWEIGGVRLSSESASGRGVERMTRCAECSKAEPTPEVKCARCRELLHLGFCASSHVARKCAPKPEGEE